MFPIIFFSLLFSSSEGARILGVVSGPTPSHQTFFHPIWKGLIQLGHELTVITASPMNNTAINLTEINTDFIYKLWQDEYHTTKLIDKYGKNLYKIVQESRKGFYKVVDKQLEHPEVQKLIQGSYGGFDLVIVEFISPVLSAFASKFNCPYLGVSVTDLNILYQRFFGHPIHPVLYPDFFIPFDGKMSFKERFVSCIMSSMLLMEDFFSDKHIEDQLIKKHFGNNMPSANEITANVSVILTNVNPAFYLRPVGPNFIPIGGLAKPEKATPLPQARFKNVLGNIQRFLDDATDGAIYFSLGTNIKSANIDRKLQDVFINTFRKIKSLKILWKFDGDIIGLPKNVMVVSWCPQQDVLRHPNIKLFITQGGVHSMEEALYFEVPILGLPFVADQEQNVRKFVNRGLGKKIDVKTITVEIFEENIMELIENPKYKQRVVEISSLSKDQPMTGFDKTIWWIEYVLRHKGAKNLRNHVVDMPFYQYYLLDVLGVILSIFLITFFLICLFIKCLCKMYFIKKRNLKNKSD
ncbi:unnamed protein product [Brassicogethes aeneus]|uniref:UDP-glucuronosyltransferase n=1 Tax=Brassicogethes aeneus TaxID=1431903 RepID=A0A9P0FAG8_BRAAE|nr:unnamed protein product [Brassicogethes aeneus]